MTDLARTARRSAPRLDNISDLTVVVADLLTQGRPLLKADVAQLRGLVDDCSTSRATRPRSTRCSTGCPRC